MKSREERARSLLVRALAAAMLGVVAVALVDCSVVIPREGWSLRWGPMVPHRSFPGDCSVCHLPEGWDVLRGDFEFDHGRETGHVLEGAHAGAACLRCHNDRGPVAMYVERGCGGCHVDPHRGNLGSACTDCHEQTLWEPIGLISEHARTRFPLVASHAVAACESCHPRSTLGEFRGTPVDCHLCHQRDAARAFPNHAVNGWVRDCERCHTPASWETPGFDHGVFPLAGGHAGVVCTSCHVGGRVTPPPSPDCFACHQNDYTAAPNHVANGFSTNCLDCHDTFAWQNAGN